MDEKITYIKNWLGTGSINIFGLPFSGKDTVGVRLAEALGAKFLSSGLILRAAEKEDKELSHELAAGNLAPTETFLKVILPYFGREELEQFPLVLSSVGRWSGEEQAVMDAAENADHDIKAVILLNISEDEVKARWEASRMLEDRGIRSDDRDIAIIDNRIKEFIEKTMPVINTYHELRKLIQIHAMGDREAVYASVVDELYKFAMSHSPSY